jgi:hypothetical protein
VPAVCRTTAKRSRFEGHEHPAGAGESRQLRRKQQSRHADSSCGRVPRRNVAVRERRPQDGFCFGLLHRESGNALSARARNLPVLNRSSLADAPAFGDERARAAIPA